MVKYTAGNNAFEKRHIYKNISFNQLQKKTPCHMDDDDKKFKVDDLIYYSGKCYEISNFYARIDNITRFGMDVTILELEYQGDNINFYETDSVKKGLTGRPFFLIDI